MVKVIFDCERVQPDDLEKKIILKDIDVCGEDILSGSETGVFWYMYKSHLLVVKAIRSKKTVVVTDFIFNVVNNIEIKDRKNAKSIKKQDKDKTVLELYREKHKKNIF